MHDVPLDSFLCLFALADLNLRGVVAMSIFTVDNLLERVLYAYVAIEKVSTSVKVNVE